MITTMGKVATMSAGSSSDAGPAGGPEGLTSGCGFPTCDRDPVTEHGMCEVHHRVVVSRTGSWLEAS
ncbi:hypothetical protein [Nocardioides sp. MH1]|uniref:hypothetical protein n=1 Tax=Nocardioides sp. MH1 TaxID=3242490 RepID=UPI0035203EA4